MQLILAIDSDPRRSEQLAALVRARLEHVDLVQATSAGEGLHALRDRGPVLSLTSPLLSRFDEGVLDDYLRVLGAAGDAVEANLATHEREGPQCVKGIDAAIEREYRAQQEQHARPPGPDVAIPAETEPKQDDRQRAVTC